MKNFQNHPNNFSMLRKKSETIFIFYLKMKKITDFITDLL